MASYDEIFKKKPENSLFDHKAEERKLKAAPNFIENEKQRLARIRAGKPTFMIVAEEAFKCFICNQTISARPVFFLVLYCPICDMFHDSNDEACR